MATGQEDLFQADAVSTGQAAFFDPEAGRYLNETQHFARK
jgi:hypothetical protein